MMDDSKIMKELDLYNNLPPIESDFSLDEEDKEHRATAVSLEIREMEKFIATINDPLVLNYLMVSIINNQYFDISVFTELFRSKTTESTSIAARFIPSEKWIDRDIGMNEKCIDFTNRIYAEVLDGFFTVADLKEADESLYHALYRLKKSDTPGGRRWNLSELNLPTKRDLYSLANALPKAETPQEEALRKLTNRESQRRSRQDKD